MSGRPFVTLATFVAAPFVRVECVYARSLNCLSQQTATGPLLEQTSKSKQTATLFTLSLREGAAITGIRVTVKRIISKRRSLLGNSLS